MSYSQQGEQLRPDISCKIRLYHCTALSSIARLNFKTQHVRIKISELAVEADEMTRKQLLRGTTAPLSSFAADEQIDRTTSCGE